MPLNNAGERVAGAESPGGAGFRLWKVKSPYQQRGIPNTGDDEKRRKTAARRSKLGPGRHNIPLQYRDAAGKVAGEEGETSSRRKRQRKERERTVGGGPTHISCHKNRSCATQRTGGARRSGWGRGGWSREREGTTNGANRWCIGRNRATAAP
mmetsp:Transcript_21930/g.47457  ORF Transcript_21930/g.47457 Transcript_21930/m.47457 type:complete len:153 (-) Transcript_21930:61-519(-)